MANFSVIDTSGLIINRVVIIGASGGGAGGYDWMPPEGCTIQEEPESGYDIGGTYVDGIYTPPARPELPPVAP